ncbi:DUF2813 domain-containing protein [Leucothrix sargassi]|nr:DUF2813 domain-containing protein [Leucothrix sargassi]
MTDNENTHLSHIKVKGFKSIGELDLEMKPINILIGANGSGKSNFISLFTFLRNLSEGRLQRYIEKEGFASKFFYFGVKTTPRISIEIDMGGYGYQAVFEHAINNDSLVFAKEYSVVYTPLPKKLYSLAGVNGESGLLIKYVDEQSDPPKITRNQVASEGFGVVTNRTQRYLDSSRVYHFHDTSSTSGFKQASDLSASDYLYANASNLAAFLYRLKTDVSPKSTKAYKDIVDSLKTVAPYFLDFYLEPRGSEGEQRVLLKWLHRDHEEPFSANQLSDGTARFICMATLFLQPSSLRPKTIILDEPELGLHPAALEVLADIVKSVSKESQVICSTQSVTFANQFEADDFIVVNQVKGASVFKRPDAESLEVWLEDYSMGDIWSKNLIGGRPEW